MIFLQYLLADVTLDPDKYIERTANFGMVASALLVSFSAELSALPWTFLGFLVGHVLWLWAGIRMNKRTLIEMNFAFLFVDAWAIGVRL